MRTPVFTGSCPALATPFDQNGNINYDAFGKLIDAQIAAGVDAVCVCGTTGESATMSIREHIAAVEFCVKRVDHRVKVIAGTGSNDTSAAVYLSQHAQDSGADACLLVTPYYNKASQTGLIKHYEYIAERIELPMILYNVPSRTGVSFTAESYKVLAQNPKINGVKEASGNFSLLAHTRFLCPDDFYIWSGNDDQVVPMMSLGAKGVISVASNIIPEVMVKMSHLCLEGQFEDASKLQIAYMDLIDALFIEVNPIPIKAAMNLMGMEAGSLRLPPVRHLPQESGDAAPGHGPHGPAVRSRHAKDHHLRMQRPHGPGGGVPVRRRPPRSRWRPASISWAPPTGTFPSSPPLPSSAGEADAVIDFSPRRPGGPAGLRPGHRDPLWCWPPPATPLSRWPKSAPLPWRCPFSAPPTCPWGSMYCWSW